MSEYANQLDEVMCLSSLCDIFSAVLKDEKLSQTSMTLCLDGLVKIADRLQKLNKVARGCAFDVQK